jgi:hypothetical protein
MNEVAGLAQTMLDAHEWTIDWWRGEERPCDRSAPHRALSGLRPSQQGAPRGAEVSPMDRA